MGKSREHFENGERRISDGKERVAKLRELADRLKADERATHRQALILRTLEKTQALLEAHLDALRQRFDDTKLKAPLSEGVREQPTLRARGADLTVLCP